MEFNEEAMRELSVEELNNFIFKLEYVRNDVSRKENRVINSYSGDNEEIESALKELTDLQISDIEKKASNELERREIQRKIDILNEVLYSLFNDYHAHFLLNVHQAFGDRMKFYYDDKSGAINIDFIDSTTELMQKEWHKHK